ncbi:MAG: patatin-like phospholipase family protein [Chloroflexi bacterium]|nr:MAG: patatin-like phospholipase family protein [Chloroflexota bacterium]
MDITLALGGGGVKGYAHIGVLRTLERAGFKIKAIAGTSAGGMVGAIYAAGYSPDEIEEHLAALDLSRLYKRNHGDGPSILGLSGALQVLTKLLGEKTFAETRIPFACTAVDLDLGMPLILNEGPLLDAVMATIAVPGIFPPKLWNGRLLVDGGVLDPVPVSLARKLAPNIPVVAVALSPPLTNWSDQKRAPRLLSTLPLLNRLNQIRLAQSFNIFLRSIDIAGCYLTDLRLTMEQPDVIIRPQVGPIGFMDKIDPLEVIEKGEKAAAAVVPKLKSLNGWRYRLSNRLPWLSDFFKQSTYDA